MSEIKKTYWKGLSQLKNDSDYVKHADKEFVDIGVENDPRHSRRDFLKTKVDAIFFVWLHGT